MQDGAGEKEGVGIQNNSASTTLVCKIDAMGDIMRANSGVAEVMMDLSRELSSRLESDDPMETSIAEITPVSSTFLQLLAIRQTEILRSSYIQTEAQLYQLQQSTAQRRCQDQP